MGKSVWKKWKKRYFVLVQVGLHQEVQKLFSLCDLAIWQFVDFGDLAIWRFGDLAVGKPVEWGAKNT